MAPSGRAASGSTGLSTPHPGLLPPFAQTFPSFQVTADSGVVVFFFGFGFSSNPLVACMQCAFSHSREHSFCPAYCRPEISLGSAEAETKQVL